MDNSNINHHQSSSAKCYDKKIKNDIDFYEKEKKRVAEYMKNRYANDENYRNKIKQSKLALYYKKKEQQQLPILSN